MVEFDQCTKKFSAALRESTRHAYTPGLMEFTEFLLDQSWKDSGKEKMITGLESCVTIGEFHTLVMKDRALPPLDQRRPEDFVMEQFIARLLEKKLAPKTVRTYAGAVQSLFKYYRTELSLKYVTNLPAAVTLTVKHPWELEKVGKFISSMNGNLLYQCTAAIEFQSGLSLSDILKLTYDHIKADWEANVVPVCLHMVRYKTRMQNPAPFRTFLGRASVKLLRAYLATLPKPLDPKAPLFQTCDRLIQRYYAQKAKAMFGKFEHRNPAGSHSLRSGFRTLMVDAECPESYVEYFMGHELNADLSKTYTAKSDNSFRKTYAKYEKAVSFRLFSSDKVEMKC